MLGLYSHWSFAPRSDFIVISLHGGIISPFDSLSILLSFPWITQHRLCKMMSWNSEVGEVHRSARSGAF